MFTDINSNKIFEIQFCSKPSKTLNFNINWRDVQRKYVVNNEDKSSLRAPWQNGRTQTNS